MAARGMAVVGIDASAKMLEQLDRRHAAQQESPIHALRADMRALPLPSRSFGAVLAAYNTVFNVGDRAGLRACFREARRVLDDAGVFVVETIVPAPADRVRSGVDVRRIAVDHVVLTASRLDPSDQTISGQHIEIAETGIRLRPWFLHYAHVDELDTIAERTGFALDARWSDWNRSAFDESLHDTQIAVYRCA
jgi:ubiquinone/menaquinone biosynthesis C-methylase UbiE